MKTLMVPGDRQEILERVRNLKPDSPRRWGRMTPHQAVCHLNDSFLAVLGDKPVSLSTNWFKRTLMKWVALQTPMPWPKDLKTRPEMDQLSGGTQPVDFEYDRSALCASMDRFVSAVQWAPHPMFGQMVAEEWMRWGYLHMDHHLRQFGC